MQAELIHRHPLTQTTGRSHQHPGALARPHLIGQFSGQFAIAVIVCDRCGIGHPISQLGRQHIHAHQLIAAAQIHGPHAPGRAAQGTQFTVIEAEVDRHALERTDQHAVARQGQAHPGEGIALLQGNGNQPIGANVGEGRQPGALDVATAGEHHQHAVFLKGAHRQQRGDLLFPGDGQQLHNRRAFGGPAAHRYPVGRHRVHHPAIAEQQQGVVVVAADKQPHRLLALALGAGLTPGAPAGGLKLIDRHPLEITGFREHHHRALIGDQVDVFEASLEVKNFRAAGG